VLRIEQLRAEILERIERLDRRSGQMELRLIRVDQRFEELMERVIRLQDDLSATWTEVRAWLADERSAHRVSPQGDDARKVN
jgi:hypothetical protein